MLAIFKRKITKDQSRDTGMGVVLLLLLLFASLRRPGLLYAGMALHVVNMLVPGIYRPLAFVWFGVSELLGAVVSKILMAVVFFVIVLPIGFLRRIMGRDSMKLRAFKSSSESVMVERKRIFTAQDVEKPY